MTASLRCADSQEHRGIPRRARRPAIVRARATAGERRTRSRGLRRLIRRFRDRTRRRTEGAQVHVAPRMLRVHSGGLQMRVSLQCLVVRRYSLDDTGQTFALHTACRGSLTSAVSCCRKRERSGRWRQSAPLPCYTVYIGAPHRPLRLQVTYAACLRVKARIALT